MTPAAPPACAKCAARDLPSSAKAGKAEWVFISPASAIPLCDFHKRIEERALAKLRARAPGPFFDLCYFREWRQYHPINAG